MIARESILVISTAESTSEINENSYYNYRYIDPLEVEQIESIIRTEPLEYIIYLGDHSELGNIFTLARIYGVPLMYPKISRYTPLSSARENWIG